MKSPETLEETLAEARAKGMVSPTFKRRLPGGWEDLRLDLPLLGLRVLLGTYTLALIAFWSCMAGVIPYTPQNLLLICAIGLLNYGLLIQFTAAVQRVLHDYGLLPHGPSHVWIAALLLNPAIVGLYVPLSVLIKALRIRREMKSAATRPR